PDALLLSVSRAQESARQMTRAFRLNLLAMSLLALAVGGFLIYNALLFSVVSRRELFARLRCLGATRAQILLLVLGEALVLGALGTAGGLALGVVLGRGILAQVTQTLGDLYFGTQVRHVPARASSLGVGALLGLGTTLAAALAPALEAASTRPREALLRSELESRWRRRLPALVAGGAALCAAAGAALWIFERSLVVSLAAVFAGVLGFALWVPPLTALAARLCERPLGAIFGPVGRLAARGIEASLSRTGVALAALAVAVSAVVGIGVMVHSFQLSLESWLDRTLYADLLVAAARPEAGEARAGFDPDWAERIAELPGVASVSTQSFGAVESPLGLLRVAALDLPQRHFPRRLQLLQGDPEQAWPAFRERGAVILSETLAYRHALAVGDSLTLHTVRGPREFPIAGIARDYATELGAVHLHRVAYERHWSPARAFSVWLERAPGTSAEALRERVEAALPPDTPAFVTSNEQLKRSALEVFGRTFAVTRGLRGIAVAVAFAGVLSAMLALALERERELAVLRAIGLLPGQLRGLIHLQTGTMGAIAGALSLPLGVGLALALIHVVNRRSFGWTLETHLSLGELAPAPVLALGAALLAGLYPAHKLGRAEPLNALREE
ncbi:MAG: FtsX-like permease family protein, partial [Proteobacteria bacterium]|nr:FtsX-like permease family protein [Pseudomonadota bacterium]